MQAQASRRAGFTIVELLVVIVVIGVLAAITIVSYSGIAKQAVVASLKSDLTNAARQLKVFHVDNGNYPTSINTCPATADTMCLKPSQGNAFDEYTRPTSQTFTLRAKNGNSVFLITDNSAPSEVAPLTAIAAVGGTPQVGTALTAGALTPSGATANYKWQSSSSSGGPFSDIAGADSNTYTPVTGDVNKYLRVVATGSGTYWDSVTSSATAAVAPIPPIFASGGTVTTSGGIRTHTFGPGTYNLTSSRSGTISIVIDGGGGGGGAGYVEYSGPYSGGLSSLRINSDTPYVSYGGGPGNDWESGAEDGSDGATSPRGLVGVTGGAGNGGSGYDEGGSGGAGGRVSGPLTIAAGQSFTIVVGGGGGGGCYDGCGGAGGPGVVTISYPG